MPQTPSLTSWGPTGTLSSEKGRLGCLFCCLHRILPTWSFSIPPTTVTQIYFQRAGAELAVCSYNSFCPTFRKLSCSSLCYWNQAPGQGQGLWEHCQEEVDKLRRREPPWVQNLKNFKAKKVVCSGVRVPNAIVFRSPFPTPVFPSPHHGLARKIPLSYALWQSSRVNKRKGWI